MCKRCQWVEGQFPEYLRYHDEEWGVPVHDDKTHFEFLILEGAQAGLSWSTILKRREGYRNAFSNFDIGTVAKYDEQKIESLLLDKGIIRNKLKVNSAVNNAQLFMKVQEEFGSFDNYIWQFTDGKTIKNAWETLVQIPAKTNESTAMSNDLKKKGFKFVGPTICYAFMQAAGMVNDHLVSCFRYNQI